MAVEVVQQTLGEVEVVVTQVHQGRGVASNSEQVRDVPFAHEALFLLETGEVVGGHLPHPAATQPTEGRGQLLEHEVHAGGVAVGGPFGESGRPDVAGGPAKDEVKGPEVFGADVVGAFASPEEEKTEEDEMDGLSCHHCKSIGWDPGEEG